MKKEHITLKLEEIKPYKKNAKKHDIERIVDSIKEHGYIADIIVDESNQILCGHGRLEALKQLKYKEAEVVKVTGLSDDDKRLYRLKDNRLTELGGWDMDMLQEEFTMEELEDMDFDLSMEEDEDLSDKNKEVDPNDLTDDSVFKLKYTQEDYYKLLQKLNELREDNETNESIIYKLIIKSDV